ncbi:response regulator transcription factor [Mucilaginibacter sp. AW1-3]
MKRRVLIAEDDNDIRDVVSYILENEGYEVIATNPRSIERIFIERADLILLDEWLNKKEGHMVCKEIKAIHEARHIPVIILSTSSQIAEIAETCNADGYVQKPFDVADLVRAVNNCLPPELVH